MDFPETIIEMVQDLLLDNNNIYTYGSWVYGTAGPLSDRDYIIVRETLPEAKREVELLGMNLTYYGPDEFQRLIDDHEVSALECLFLPKHFVVREDLGFDFNLDLEKLRRSFSQKSSNSWVKAKKKIDLHQEYRLGMKSLFHAFRILTFGIQIAEQGMITDYTASNPIWRAVLAKICDYLHARGYSTPDLLTIHKAVFRALKDREDVIAGITSELPPRELP